MNHIIVGLGNPGPEYEKTRHNAGRLAVSALWKLAEKNGEAGEWKLDKKLNAQKTTISFGKKKATLILPETFMNNSGKAIKPLITSIKQAESLVVVHDDLDLPLGAFKICFNRGSSGHRGVDSIMRAIKTEKFTRIKIGVSPTTPGGKLKKPKGEEAVVKFVIGAIKPAEFDELKKVNKKVAEALVCLIEEGRDRAMNQYN